MKTNTITLNFEYGLTSEIEEDQLLTLQDQVCFAEIREILKKHQALNRFGIALLIDKDLPNHLIRLETNSSKERTLITHIVNNDFPRGNLVQTNWRLNTIKAVAVCSTTCMNSNSRHSSSHTGPSPEPGQSNQ